MSVEQTIKIDKLNLKITLLELSFVNLAIAARNLATEADEWLNHTNDCDAETLEHAIDRANQLSLGIKDDG